MVRTFLETHKPNNSLLNRSFFYCVDKAVDKSVGKFRGSVLPTSLREADRTQNHQAKPPMRARA